MLHALPGREYGQQQRNCEENTSQINGGFSQHRRGLSTKNVFRHAAAEGCSQSFVFRPLHQHDKNQQRADDHQDRKHNRNENTQPHKGGNMECGPPVVKWMRKERTGAEPVDRKSRIAEVQSYRPPDGAGKVILRVIEPMDIPCFRWRHASPFNPIGNDCNRGSIGADRLSKSR
jgi:hypothetical protein